MPPGEEGASSRPGVFEPSPESGTLRGAARTEGSAGDLLKAPAPSVEIGVPDAEFLPVSYRPRFDSGAVIPEDKITALDGEEVLGAIEYSGVVRDPKP